MITAIMDFCKYLASKIFLLVLLKGDHGETQGWAIAIRVKAN